jgi:ribosomal protein L27
MGIPERQIDPNEMNRRRKAHALKNSYRYFGNNVVNIKTKRPGEVVKLKFNEAQEFIDFAVNKMLAEKGWVRIIIVKGRQQGVSTYIDGRILWKCFFQPNTDACIISHETKSTAALSDKISFALHHLDPSIKVELIKDNTYEIKLPNGSKIVVITAGTEESGRSQTAHIQHQSERALYKNAEAIDAGAGQIVALERGTEVYKESTSFGFNHFSKEVFDALAGKGVFRVIFVPWYWQREYRMEVPSDFQRTDDEHRLIEIYGKHGLCDDEQLQWRRDKIIELKSLRKFRQEYPNNLMESFQASGDSFFDSDLVQKARDSQVEPESFSPLILGVDPAGSGDRTVLALRRGRRVIKLWKYDEMNTDRLVGIVSKVIDKYNVDKCFIDWGYGHGAIDILKRRRYGRIVEGVNFGGAADQPIYADKRAEMFHRLRDWLSDGDVGLPDDDDMAADLACLPAPEDTSNGKLRFIKKKLIRKEYGRSPDILDAISLTFAYNVRGKADDKWDAGSKRNQTKQTRRKSSLTSLADIRRRRRAQAA